MPNEIPGEPTTAAEPAVTTDVKVEKTQDQIADMPSAAEIVAKIAEEQKAEPAKEEATPTKEPVKEKEEPTPPEVEAAPEIKDDPDADSEESEEELTLDPELAKDPKLKERWDQQVKGVEKLVTRLKHEREGIGVWAQIAPAFENPATAWDAFDWLETNLKRSYGERKGKEPARPSTENWEELGFDSEDDYAATLKFVDRVTKPQIDALTAEIRTLKEERQGEKQAAAAEQNSRKFKAALDEVTPQVIEYAKTTDQGWKVTPDMVEKAVREFPSLAKKPYEALKAKYGDQRTAHLVSLARKSSGKAPELLTEIARNAGTEVEMDPEKWSVTQIVKQGLATS